MYKSVELEAASCVLIEGHRRHKVVVLTLNMNDIMITLQSAWPVIDLLHERWPVTGAWTILPLMSRSVAKSTKHI